MSFRAALTILCLALAAPALAGVPGLEDTPDPYPPEEYNFVTQPLALPELPPQVCRDDAPVTRGLFVGVGVIGGDPKWDLRGPANDLQILGNAVQSRGARASDIRLLGDPDATRNAVEAALADLIAKVNCGDSVILYFGGHSLGDDPRGPWFFLSPTEPGKRDLLSAAAISQAVTALRRRGADVSVILDVVYAESFAIADRQPDGTHRYQFSLEDDPAPPLSPSTRLGELSVYYATGVDGLALEKRLPTGSRDRKTYGLFSFFLATAILESEVTTPPALMRYLRGNASLAAELQSDQQRNDFVFTTTNPDHRMIATGDRPAPAPQSGAGAEVIRILSPEQTRAAAPLESATLLLEGRVDSPARTLIVLVNGEEVPFDPDGTFRAPLELEAGLNAVKVLALTETNRPITTELELYYEGDIQALLGTGQRYALLIANQDYPEGSGIADLQTPIGDAQALADVLTADYGYVTRTTGADGQPLNLFLQNPTAHEVKLALWELSRIAGERDSVLIFYAGHGVYEEATGKANWLLADAVMGLPPSWLSSDTISDSIQRMNAGSVLLISDSCYSGALLRGDEMVAIEDVVADKDRLLQLQRTAAKRSRILLTSGGNEPVLDGGGSGHSVFAAALLAGLREMDMDAFTTAELYAGYLLPRVVGRAVQEPQFRPVERSGHEGGDVVWVRQRG